MTKSGLRDELDRRLKRYGMMADVGDMKVSTGWVDAGGGAECGENDGGYCCGFASSTGRSGTH